MDIYAFWFNSDDDNKITNNKLILVDDVIKCIQDLANYHRRILNTKKGNNGFGYDPIFVPNGLDQTFGELDPEIKLSIDHRFVAFSKIKTFFY